VPKNWIEPKEIKMISASPKRKKMWVTLPDENTCESCKKMNGQIVDEDEYFEFEGYKLYGPPLLDWMAYVKGKDGKYKYKLIKKGCCSKKNCRCGLFFFYE